MQLDFDFKGEYPEWYYRYIDWDVPVFLLDKVISCQKNNGDVRRYKTLRKSKIKDPHIFNYLPVLGDIFGVVWGDSYYGLEVTLPKLTMVEQQKIGVELVI